MFNRKNMHLLAACAIGCLSSGLTAVMVIEFTQGFKSLSSYEGPILTVGAIIAVCGICCLFVALDRLSSDSETAGFWPGANGTPINRGCPMTADLPANNGASQVLN